MVTTSKDPIRLSEFDSAEDVELSPRDIGILQSIQEEGLTVFSFDGSAHHFSIVPFSVGFPFASYNWKLIFRCQGFNCESSMELATVARCSLSTNAVVSCEEASTVSANIAAAHKRLSLGPRLLVIMQQAQHVIRLKLLPPLQKIKLNGEPQSCNLAAELPHELDRSLHRSASRQQIVDNHNPLPRLNRVQMNL